MAHIRRSRPDSCLGLDVPGRRCRCLSLSPSLCLSVRHCLAVSLSLSFSLSVSLSLSLSRSLSMYRADGVEAVRVDLDDVVRP